MRSAASRFVPRRKNAIVRQVSDEFLVYDKELNKAHCLNQVAGRVWNLCDGRRSAIAIIRELQNSTQPMDEKFVWMALDQMAKAGLLINQIPTVDNNLGLSRRTLIRKLGAAAALALPVVASIAVPTPASAVSCLANGKPCSMDSQCCSGHCRSTTHCGM